VNVQQFNVHLLEPLPVIRTLPTSVRDAVLLVARLVLGVVLVAHGWQKVVSNGIGATAEGFAGVGVPLAPVSVAYAALVELIGGAPLLAGAATALVGVLVALDVLGAALLVHIGSGVFAGQGGWELVGVIGVLALVLVAVGAGRFSVDHALGARRSAATV
jgi:putative oxidoreductase